jgi:hypothetical protein
MLMQCHFTGTLCTYAVGTVLNKPVKNKLRFCVLTLVSMKMRALWDIALCSLITLMMEAVGTSQMSVYSETTWLYIPEGSHLQETN